MVSDIENDILESGASASPATIAAPAAPKKLSVAEVVAKTLAAAKLGKKSNVQINSDLQTETSSSQDESAEYIAAAQVVQ